MTVERQRWVMAGGECWHYERSCAEHNLRADQAPEAYPLETAGVPSFFRPCKRCVPLKDRLADFAGDEGEEGRQ